MAAKDSAWIGWNRSSLLSSCRRNPRVVSPIHLHLLHPYSCSHHSIYWRRCDFILKWKRYKKKKKTADDLYNIYGCVACVRLRRIERRVLFLLLFTVRSELSQSLAAAPSSSSYIDVISAVVCDVLRPFVHVCVRERRVNVNERAPMRFST